MHGVPQGSILGPLFFLAYMNDIFNVSDFLYADDTCLYLSGRDLCALINLMNTNEFNEYIDDIEIKETPTMKYLRVIRHEIFPEFRNFYDLRGHSRGDPRSGLIFMGGGGGGRGLVGTINCV